MTVTSTKITGRLSEIVAKAKNAAQQKNEAQFLEHLKEWGHLYSEENATSLAEKYFKLDRETAKSIFKEFNKEK